MSDWYYQTGRRVYGPYSEQDLRQKIKSGEISANTSVSRNGFTGWQKASKSLLQEDAPPGTNQDKTASRQKFAGFFTRPQTAGKPRAGSGDRSRTKALYWCIAIAFAGAIGCVVVKSVGVDRFTEYARRISRAWQGSRPDVYTLEETRDYWLAIQRIEKTASENAVRNPAIKNVLVNDADQPDKPRLTEKDFESLREYQSKQLQVARNLIDELEKLPVAGVDPALLHYKLEVSELWSVVERACMEFTEITDDTREWQLCFASPEAYALRFGTNGSGPSEMDYQNHKSQEQIAAKIRKLRALSEETTVAQADLSNRKEQVKTLLTSRYGWKFQ
jgi:hypothetical protein